MTIIRKGRLIVFVGPVGVGKSTIQYYLAFLLEKRGYKVSVEFIKAFHYLSFAIWMFILRLTLSKKLSFPIAPWYIISKYNRTLAEKLTFLLSVADILFSIPLKLLKIKFLKFFKHYILCEEYLIGAIIDYLYTLHNIQSLKERNCLRSAITFLLKLLNRYKPFMIITLDASEDYLLERWRRRGYGDPQGKYIVFQRVFIEKQLIFGNKLIKGVKTYYIDTSNKGVSDIIKEIISLF
jgi:broad-specificity NMP kinase